MRTFVGLRISADVINDLARVSILTSLPQTHDQIRILFPGPTLEAQGKIYQNKSQEV